jgi:cytochrome P450
VLGPLNCIGMRFAIEELKIALCSVIKKLRIYSVDETPVTEIISDIYSEM